MIPGLSQSFERLWLIRFGFVHASQMVLMWARFTGLGDTQLGTGRASIVAAYHRAGDFRESPLMGGGYGCLDTASREEP